ncbi:cell division protein ZapE [Cognatiluteimonas weifangensis]|uniref:Cell division protein ZapE n=1 Tax=Cognatiluteimonas weifangensis TaxID=2303539 RepID=A0A372DPV2_9GAMM|nr:cell division protein ZapE [Luteimonas weifangensis]RFP61407.1 cell division protein ZapE [Luteimonas weifangensis]
MSEAAAVLPAPGAPAGPWQRYAAGVARGDWQDDPAQHAALRELDRIHAALLAPARGGVLARWLRGNAGTPAPRGLYLWGGVGRGKTFLIDLFHDSLPFPEVKAEGLAAAPARRGAGHGKRRTHFHRFMRTVHERLRAHAGERDPLRAIAREWRAQLRVLVLDEFFVSDIGDAMLLGRLLERLFAEGVVLVTSSNTPPAQLYHDGLQRARFLPAIALLQRHCAVLHLDSPQDYRLRALTRSPVYRQPLDAQSDAWLQARWRELGGDSLAPDGRPRSIELDGRKLPVRARGDGMVWFDFAALCEGPRAAADYIEIAREFHTVLLGGIPVLDARSDDAARRFVTLIDELYDRHVNLVCSAAAPPPQLYAGERLAGAFERTASRLIEMRSAQYLAQEHRG